MLSTLRQEDHCKFEASLGFLVSARLAYATYRI